MVEYLPKTRYTLSMSAITEQQLDTIFHALADATRRKILNLIAEIPLRVTDIAAQFETSLNAISKHLKVLEKAGLMTRKKDGRVYHCKTNTERLKEVENWILPYKEYWQVVVASRGRHT